MASYSKETLQLVWEKGMEIMDRGPSVWRRDAFGNLIRRQDYGNRKSDYGWEVDHIIPVSMDGSDELPNLRPLQWEANVRRIALHQRPANPT